MIAHPTVPPPYLLNRIFFRRKLFVVKNTNQLFISCDVWWENQNIHCSVIVKLQSIVRSNLSFKTLTTDSNYEELEIHTTVAKSVTKCTKSQKKSTSEHTYLLQK